MNQVLIRIINDGIISQNRKVNRKSGQIDSKRQLNKGDRYEEDNEASQHKNRRVNQRKVLNVIRRILSRLRVLYLRLLAKDLRAVSLLRLNLLLNRDLTSGLTNLNIDLITSALDILINVISSNLDNLLNDSRNDKGLTLLDKRIENKDDRKNNEGNLNNNVLDLNGLDLHVNGLLLNDDRTALGISSLDRRDIGLKKRHLRRSISLDEVMTALNLERDLDLSIYENGDRGGSPFSSPQHCAPSMDCWIDSAQMCLWRTTRPTSTPATARWSRQPTGGQCHPSTK